MMNIYIANLGKYNEGILKGAWLELPATEEEIQEKMVEIGVATYDEEGNFSMGKNEGIYHYEEYAIHDWECDIDGFDISEYDSIKILNEVAEQFENMHEWEKECINALIEYDCYTAEKIRKNMDIQEMLDDHIFIALDREELNDDRALGHAIAEMDGTLEKLEELGLDYYFDYEKYGRDARYNGVYIASNNIAIL